MNFIREAWAWLRCARTGHVCYLPDNVKQVWRCDCGRYVESYKEALFG